MLAMQLQDSEAEGQRLVAEASHFSDYNAEVFERLEKAKVDVSQLQSVNKKLLSSNDLLQVRNFELWLLVMKAVMCYCKEPAAGAVAGCPDSKSLSCLATFDSWVDTRGPILAGIVKMCLVAVGTCILFTPKPTVESQCDLPPSSCSSAHAPAALNTFSTFLIPWAHQHLRIAASCAVLMHLQSFIPMQSELEATSQAGRQQVSALEQQLAAAQEQEGHLADAKQQLAARLEELTQQLAATQQQEDALASQTRDQGAAIDDMSQQLAAAQAREEQLSSEKRDQSGRIELLDQQLLTAQQRGDQLAAQNCEQASRYEALEKEHVRVTTQLDGVLDANGQLRDANSALQAELKVSLLLERLMQGSSGCDD